MSNIPASTSITPRPVWARYLRRYEAAWGKVGPISLPPPTDAEKHDAILVLKYRERLTEDEELCYAEAQRIMDECS